MGSDRREAGWSLSSLPREEEEKERKRKKKKLWKAWGKLSTVRKDLDGDPDGGSVVEEAGREATDRTDKNWNQLKYEADSKKALKKVEVDD